jgi:hypothetical protein
MIVVLGYYRINSLGNVAENIAPGLRELVVEEKVVSYLHLKVSKPADMLYRGGKEILVGPDGLSPCTSQGRIAMPKNCYRRGRHIAVFPPSALCNHPCHILGLGGCSSHICAWNRDI